MQSVRPYYQRTIRINRRRKETQMGHFKKPWNSCILLTKENSLVPVKIPSHLTLQLAVAIVQLKVVGNRKINELTTISCPLINVQRNSKREILLNWTQTIIFLCASDLYVVQIKCRKTQVNFRNLLNNLQLRLKFLA